MPRSKRNPANRKRRSRRPPVAMIERRSCRADNPTELRELWERQAQEHLPEYLERCHPQMRRFTVSHEDDETKIRVHFR